MLSSQSLRPVRDAWDRMPGNARGAVWISLAGLGFTGMIVCMKLLGRSMSLPQMLVLRSLFAVLWISPAILKIGIRTLRPVNGKGHVLRSFLGLGGITCLYLSATHLDLALVTTLGFTRVLFVIVLALLFLNERIRWRRSLATIVGFAGVLICVRPGSAGFDAWTLVGMLAALFAASVSTMIKHLTSSESPQAILFWSYLLIGIAALAPALWYWHWPSAEELLIVGFLSLFTALGQTCMVFGLRAGEATAVIPFEYSRLIYALAIGYLLFAEIPSLWTLAGGAVIIGSTLYIALREIQLGKRR